MSNKYCQSSSLMSIQSEKIDEALAIVDQIFETLSANEEDGDSLGVNYKKQTEGIWFHHEECFDVNFMEQIAKEIIETLKIENCFFFSWASYCDKPVIDEFSGGGCLVRLGKETEWFCPEVLAEEAIRNS